MSEEEKRTIEILKDDEMYITDSFYREFRTTIADKYTKAFAIVLNLIEKQQAEIENLKNRIKHQDKEMTKAVDYTFELNTELEKKDKIINKMSEQLTSPIHSKEWVIEYYTKEVEDK